MNVVLALCGETLMSPVSCCGVLQHGTGELAVHGMVLQDQLVSYYI